MVTTEKERPLAGTTGIARLDLDREMRKSYLDYAMSVIVGRALPDARDGLKPVHRRILYSMHESGHHLDKPFKKSARICGNVVGKYHPHGDSAVYDAVVRLVQDFSMRYPLIQGQGNFGSVDGDAAAAMRYTEVRLAKIAAQLLTDIDKDTVDFIPNYDNTEQQPVVLPARLPNLLINGVAGIAVGMATNIPSHNLAEIVTACMHLLQNPNCSDHELIAMVPGPDFPTGGIIHGTAGIQQAYLTGRGRIHVRAKTHFEHKQDRTAIIVDELPFKVNKARLLQKIAELVKEKRIQGISVLRDESDKRGMRVCIELRRGENEEIVLNNLFHQTALESVFGINMVALERNIPKLYTLRELLQEFLDHRKEVVLRRSWFEMNKARKRAHVLEGLSVALANIDAIIACIKRAPTPSEAKKALTQRDWQATEVRELLERAQESHAASGQSSQPPSGLMPDGRYRLTEAQAQAILDLRLHRLTNMEQDKIHQEYREGMERIAELKSILSSPVKLVATIMDELQESQRLHQDERRTEIVERRDEIVDIDLIPPEDRVVILTAKGYVKSVALSEFRVQGRGGRGVTGASVKQEDLIEQMLIANTHDTLMFVSNLGQLYWLRLFELPQASRNARGRPIVNMLKLREGERISRIVVKSKEMDHAEQKVLVFCTREGMVKKTPLSAYTRQRTAGIRAVRLIEGDELIGAQICSEHSEILLFNNAGFAIRFALNEVRSTGRVAAGVRGMRLKKDQKVIAMIGSDHADQDDTTLMLISTRGYGKRIRLNSFRTTHRGGVGVKAIELHRDAQLLGAREVADQDRIMMVSDSGFMTRVDVEGVSLKKTRSSRGVRIMKLQPNERLVGMGVESCEAQ